MTQAAGPASPPRAPTQPQLEAELAQLLVATLNIEGRDPATIDPESPLFGDYDAGWGLDSIDALEIALAVQQKYGIELRAEDEVSRHALASIRALAGHIAAQRPAG